MVTSGVNIRTTFERTRQRRKYSWKGGGGIQKKEWENAFCARENEKGISKRKLIGHQISMRGRGRESFWNPILKNTIEELLRQDKKESIGKFQAQTLLLEEKERKKRKRKEG